jgi:hypothetical protein
LFDNLELVRTVRALGGRELVAYDIFIARRLRLQTFSGSARPAGCDEFVRPRRGALALSVVPLVAAAIR